MAKHRRKTETTRNILYGATALIGVGLIAGAAYWVTDNLRAGPAPVPGASTVAAPSAGDSDREEISRTALALEDAMASAPLTVRVGEAEFALDPAEVGFDLDEEALAEQVLQSPDPPGLRGRIQALAEGGTTLPEGLELVGSVSERAVDGLLADYENEVLDVPFEGSIRLRGDAPVADYPRPGRQIDRASAIEAVTGALFTYPRSGTVDLEVVDRTPLLAVSAISRALDEAEALLAGPVTLNLRRVDASDPDAGESPDPEEPARSITLDRDLLVSAFYSRLEREPVPRMVVGFDPALFVVPLETLRGDFEDPPVNASVTTDREDNVVIVPGVPGSLLDPEAAAQAAAEAAGRADRTADLIVREGAQPEVTTDDILALGIKEKISEFTTQHSCCQPRVTNIQLFADIIDGTIVMPGDVLSLNDTVGERTRERGFKPAPTIIRGKLEDTVGGGVSQFATTFYNAVFYAGLEDIEHRPHSYYFSRYPEGNEATISWREPDLIFRNDTEAAVLIRTQYTDTSITVKFFGDNGGRQVRRWLSGRYSPTEPAVEYTANPERDHADGEYVTVEGRGGWSVTVGRVITYADGTEKEERWGVRYRARPREVEVHPCLLPEDHEEFTGEECPPEESTTSTEVDDVADVTDPAGEPDDPGDVDATSTTSTTATTTADDPGDVATTVTTATTIADDPGEVATTTATTDANADADDPEGETDHPGEVSTTTAATTADAEPADQTPTSEAPRPETPTTEAPQPDPAPEPAGDEDEGEGGDEGESGEGS